MDESLATTLVTNLIKNAFLHTADGGTIDISLQDGTLTVSNSGEETLDATRLFDRFYTVDSARKSTGLGLSIAKLLTERMGGNISADYKGNMLSITLSFE